MQDYTFLISPEDVDKIRSWFDTRGGVVMWRNVELGNQRPDQITPAKCADGNSAVRPHWAYSNPVFLEPGQIGIRTETKIPVDRATSRVKRMYWGGYELVSNKKAEKIASKLGADVKYSFEFTGNGNVVDLVFYREKIEPFVGG